MKLKKCIIIINIFLLLFTICAPLGYSYENEVSTNEEVDNEIIEEIIDNEVVENNLENEITIEETSEIDEEIVENTIEEAIVDNSIEIEEIDEAYDTVEEETIVEIDNNVEVVQEDIIDEEVSSEEVVEEVETSGEAINTPSVIYTTHVQNIGWQEEKSDGQMAGTEGQALRLEGIKISLKNAEGSIKYQTHVQNIGWQEEKLNGNMSGTEGQALRLEAIKISLSGDISELYSIKYRVHVQNYGWLGWAKDGELAGTEGFGLRMEAIEIKLDTKIESGTLMSDSNKPFYRSVPSLVYKTHVQNIGWSCESNNCECIGTTGRALRLEALQLKLPNTSSLTGGIEYSAHVQNVGWQNFVKNGKTAGTTGQGLRMEAIKIRLTGEFQDNYDIYYRAHCERVGWLDWAKNGEIAGTTGCAYRLEAIQIVLVEKGSASPGRTITPYLSNQTGILCIDSPRETHIGASNKQLRIEGWALSTSSDTNIKIYIDGNDVGNVDRKNRDDVLNAHQEYRKNNPTPGYVKLIDFTKLTNARHEVKVVLYDSKSNCTLAQETTYFVKYKDIRYGIDVSRHNAHPGGGYQRIDWATVKNQIDFAIVRCGYGQNLDDNGGYRQDDDEFYYNMNECRKYNIPVEVYLYSYADNTTKANNEADHVLRLCKNYKDIVHMIWYDVEDDYLFNKVKSGQVSKSTVGDIVNTFADRLKANGYNVGLYSYKSALQTYFPTDIINKYDIWLAHFVNGVNQQNVLSNMSSYPGTYVMWQYTSAGTVAGIATAVDCNLRFVDFY